MVVLAELGNGFVYALTHVRATPQKAIRTVAIILFTILMIMNLVDVVYGGVIWGTFNGGYGGGDSYFSDRKPLNNMIMAFYFLSLFISIALLVQAALVKRTYRKQTSSSNVSLGELFHEFFSYPPPPPFGRHVPTGDSDTLSL